MTVPVEINGKPKQFLLDIGTNPTEVSQATVAELSLPQNVTGGDTMQIGPAGFMTGKGQAMTAPIYDVKGSRKASDYQGHVRIASFAMGSAATHGLIFLVSNDDEMGKSEPYDGLMTGDFFKQYDVELDFGQREIYYLTPTKCSDPNQVVYWSHTAVAAIPMTNLDGKMHVQVTVEGHPIDAVIDTSSARTVMRRDIAELTLGFKANTADMKPEGDLKDGKGEQVYGHTFSQISFAGGVTALNVPALIQTNSMIHVRDQEPVLGSHAQTSAAPDVAAFTLGMDVLHQLHLYIVPGQKMLYVTAGE